MPSLQEHLAPALIPLGFSLENKLGGLNYCATLEGYQIKVHCSCRTQTKYAGEIRYQQYVGHRLEISVETTVKTRLSVAKELNLIPQKLAQWLNQKAGSQPVTGLNSFYDLYQVWASDRVWSHSFLQLEGIMTVMKGLLPRQSKSSILVSLKLVPGSVIFYQQLPAKDITPPQLKYWIEATIYIAKMAERSPPSTIAELSWWEQQLKDKPMTSAIVIFGGFLILFVFLGLLFSAFLILISIVLSSI